MTLLLRASSLRHLHLVPVAALLFAAHTMVAQAPAASTKPSAPAAVPDRAASYYHYGLARLYEDMAVNAGRSDYATQAVEQYKLALDADPNSRLLQDGLADLYFKIGRIREAVTAAQDQVGKDPNDIEAHTLLGKVYLRSLGDMQNAQSGQMLQLAIGEYEKLAQLKAEFEQQAQQHHLYPYITWDDVFNGRIHRTKDSKPFAEAIKAATKSEGNQ